LSGTQKSGRSRGHPIQPTLDRLSLFGGCGRDPLTSALLAGSDAIDHGDNAGCPSTDQRGAHRPVGGTCDIGAFEFGGVVARLWLPLVRR
jgi:hypothetical protein